jgi:hypothetical protein
VIGERRQEFVLQVAMRHVQFDGIDADALGALRRIHECGFDAIETRRPHRNT